MVLSIECLDVCALFWSNIFVVHFTSTFAERLGDIDTPPGWRKLFQLSQLAHLLIVCAACRAWNHWFLLCISFCTSVRILGFLQCVSKAYDPRRTECHCGWVARKLPAEQPPPVKSSDDSTTSRPIIKETTIAAKSCKKIEGRDLTNDTAPTKPLKTPLREVSFYSATSVDDVSRSVAKLRRISEGGDDHHADESSSNSVIPATSDVISGNESGNERSEEHPELPSRPQPRSSLRSRGSSRLAMLRKRAKSSSDTARGADGPAAENCHKLQCSSDNTFTSSSVDAPHRGQDGIGIEQPQLIADPSSADVQKPLSVVASPKKRPVKSRPPMTELTAATFGLDLSSLEVMVVEDDGIQQVVVDQFLKRQGLKTVCVDSGDDALSLLADRERNGATFPGVILMDLMMPGLNGHETTEKIRTLYPSAALDIIMLTSDERDETVVEALRRGANDILTKIHLKGCLMARIAAHLSTRSNKLDAQKNEQLLKEILPDSVIRRLNQGPRLICDEHAEVSIVFTDVVGFTDLASSVPTIELVDMLDKLFNTFDTLSDKHGVYKVETIGDAYMVVAGHEASSQGDHAIRAVQMAADMVEAASCMTMPNGKPLKIRAGVHSGPAFSGVVGWKRPRFCMFGDTVNVASRMESTSFSCCVQLSNGTREYYRAQQEKMSDSAATEVMDFKCLGPRDIKGKGNMTTFLAKVGDWEEAVKDLDS